MIRAPRSTLALLSSAALVAATAGTAVAAPGHSEHSRARLAGSVPSWATAAHRQHATAGHAPVDFKLYLDWRHSDQAAGYAQAASTGKATFLTPAQFRSRFAPSRQEVSAAKQWLRSEGFTVGFVPSNHKYVEASGTAAKASQAFGTSFAQYHVQGISLRSNTTPLSVPAGLHVEAVTGLDQSYALAKSDAPPPGGFRNARPCSHYWGEKTVQATPAEDGTALPQDPPNWTVCGYTPKQLQAAYGMKKLIANGHDGSGVTVGIIDAYASPTAESDLKQYSADHGLPPANLKQYYSPGTAKRPNNKQHSPSGWSGEEALDLEAVHSMAPGANIVYVGSPNSRQDMDAALNKMVNNDLADIVSNSYGFAGEAVPSGYRKPFNDIAQQAAAEGISLFFSSGDYGDETGGSKDYAKATPDWPASSPWVTAVGGTSLGVGQNGARDFELGWETAKGKLTTGPDGQPAWGEPQYVYGAGGGTSRFYSEPTWQQGVVPSTMATAGGHRAQPMRVVPDVAALADPTTGMLVGQTQQFPSGTKYAEYRIGGTSLASPLYAGMFALVVQDAGRMGLANPALYSTAGSDANHDIVPQSQNATDPTTNPAGVVRPDYANSINPSGGYVYTLRTFDDHSQTIGTAVGYDDVTGIGTPNGLAWVHALVHYGRQHHG